MGHAHELAEAIAHAVVGEAEPSLRAGEHFRRLRRRLVVRDGVLQDVLKPRLRRLVIEERLMHLIHLRDSGTDGGRQEVEAADTRPDRCALQDVAAAERLQPP